MIKMNFIPKLTHTACSKSIATVSYKTDYILTIRGVFNVFITKRGNIERIQKTPLIEGFWSGRGRTRTYDHRLVRAAL